MTAHINFLKNRQIIQQTLKIENTFDQQFYNVLNYEEKIQKTFQMMDQAVHQKVEFISLLKNKQIEVLNLVKKATELRKIQLKVRNSINELSIINSSNKDLVSLQICYLETLSFQEKDLIIDLDLSYLNDIHLSQIDTQLIRQKLKIRQVYAQHFQNNQMDDSYQDFNLFSKHSCVIYAQVEENYNLSIKKVSSSFLQLFGITQQDAQDKRIEILMPPNAQLINKHRQYIVSYFQNQNNKICYLKEKNLFGYQQKGFIFPIKVDVRLNYSNGLSQLGLTAYIQRIYDENDYILFQSDFLNVIGATQNILKNVFLKNNIEIQKQSDLGQFFPFLYKLMQDNKAKLLVQQKEVLDIQDSDTQNVNSLKELLIQNSINQKYTKIIDEHNFEKFKLQNEEYMLIIQNFQSSNRVKNQVKLQNTSFFLVEISINDCEYKDIDNLHYMKISKIKPIQPELNLSIILKYLKEYQEFYSLVFTKQTLETLQAELESKHLQVGSLDISNFNFHSNKQNNFQSQFNQIQTTQKFLVENRFSENKSQDLDDLNQNNTLSPRKSQKFRINKMNNQSFDKIQEENSQQQATLSEQQCQIYPQNKQNNAQIQVDIPDQDNTYYHSPRDAFSQNFRNQQDDISQQQIRDIQYENEEIKYAIPLTSNRKETNRELLSEVYFNSQSNINSLKQIFDVNQQFQNVKPSTLNNNDISEKQLQQLKSTQEITSLKVIENPHSITLQQRFYQDQDILSQNLQNINETKLATQKYSLKKEKKRKKLREDQLENNSSSVSRESTSSTKKIIIKTIKQQTSLSAIKVVILFGFLTYLALSIITIQQYFNFIDSVDSMNQNQNSQNWPYEVQNVINRSLRNYNIIHSERQNNFNFVSKEDQNSFDAQLINQLQQSQKQFMYLIQTMDFSLSGKMLYNRISNFNSSFYINQIYNSSNLSNTSSKRTTYSFEEKNSSLLYSIIFVNYNIYQQSINPTGKLQQICILQNLQNIMLGNHITKIKQ
ncbi:transmembrane protein, putative (macronuclear) [Tetrahymena thermophila SB210]|uniref:Transmembrane protein, putative n=1 Tax=Tetrahymena thermophila (strain SB210) TaxID=312017 RepID=Q24DB8_TETTS|nr:transmembrane protein, putative [Tetrahymena thermophila SB210]EAS05787.2 transmembrane protein, putative [Tetrahymena thermophila SB210]|eukprot:XP_001026032.2 transmembrane protein, putative [Tetrahymena thermophila SB210]